MSLALIGPIAGIFNNIIGLGKEFVVDKDKQIEFAFKIAELQHDLLAQVMTMQTTPKVDAFVKILYAIKELVIPMLRPIGTGLITAFGLYAHYKGIQIPEAIHAGLDAAFGTWVYSRHVEKK